MGKRIKVSEGDLFVGRKKQVACVTRTWHDEVVYIVIGGKNRGLEASVDQDDFLDKYPNRVNKIIIE